ncbi:hypothetical protein TNCV_3175001 [Trichonephila clavipes]|nr:hypothetical protein TNCV_3175001 [Trichonephila clavipes]
MTPSTKRRCKDGVPTSQCEEDTKGGPVRSRRSREKQQYSPYAEEQRKSSSRNTRRRNSIAGRGQEERTVKNPTALKYYQETSST